MSRTVLVTGVAGFVGPHLVRELAGAGWRVVGLDRAPESDVGDLGPLDEYVATSLEQPLPTGMPVPDAVVHLAGRSNVAESFADPAGHVTANTAMTLHLGQHLLEHAPGCRLLLVSTGALYAPREAPLDEQAPLALGSPYAVGKAAAESCADYFATRGLETVMARPFNHIGPGQRPGFLLPDLAAGVRALGEGAALAVGDLSTRRDYTDVRDVVAAYRALLEAPVLRHRHYNVCSGTTVSGEELLAEVCAGLGRPVPTTRTDPARVRPHDPARLVGDATRLRDETGWGAARGWRAAVGDFLAQAAVQPARHG